MSDFVILTDSSADFNEAMARELNVQLLPLHYSMGEKTYFNYPDNRDMDPHEFYDMLRNGQTASTAALNVADYTLALEPLLEAGKDVLILAFSSGLSSTYQSACLAAEDMKEKYPRCKIYVVDTLCASLGQGLLVCHAVRKQREGKSIDEVRDWVEENKLHLCHQFTVDDLMFLKRGGRISGTTAVVGSMLNIKPVLHVDNEGHLVNIGKVRGRAAAIRALADKMGETAIDPANQVVFISHGDCLKDAETLADMIRERFGVKDIRMNYVGPVIGAHSGPGTLALFYLGTQR